jgi:hypothetical protein
MEIEVYEFLTSVLDGHSAVWGYRLARFNGLYILREPQTSPEASCVLSVYQPIENEQCNALITSNFACCLPTPSTVLFDQLSHVILLIFFVMEVED